MHFLRNTLQIRPFVVDLASRLNCNERQLRLVPDIRSVFFLLPLHKMTSGNSSVPPIMYYALPAESPLQLIANPGRTWCLSIRAGVVTRNCIFHDLIWAVNLSARTVAFDLRGHAKRPASCFFFSQYELESAVRSLAAANV